MNELPPIDELSHGLIDIKPIQTTWYDETGERAGEDETTTWWEAFRYDMEASDRSLTVVASMGDVVACFTDDGSRIQVENGEYELEEFGCETCDGKGTILEQNSPDSNAQCHDCDGTGNTLKLTAAELAELSEIEVYSHGTQGPVMNYRYPLGTAERDHVGGYHRRTDAIGAAFRLRGLPLCIVEYDGAMALALTGGGMDFSWEINEAFVLLGYLPPVHFDMDKMAGKGVGELDRYLLRAYDESLTSMLGRLQRAQERHREMWRSALAEEGS